MADQDFTFTINMIRFDEDYQPSVKTRATTNFANLARGKNRQENLRNALNMIDNRFNALAHWDNPTGDRYCVELEIISVELQLWAGRDGDAFPLIEFLTTSILDQKTGQRYAGMVGNNFSSHIRDYDFSVVLPAHNQDRTGFTVPADFGDLHGKLFRHFVNSNAYKVHFHKPPVICLSASRSKEYFRTDNRHPILGIEYRQNDLSLTDQYFGKMGLQARYFMPPDSVAPLAFYFSGDLLCDYSNLELISIISTMETFQKIYRPEIYNANSVAGVRYQPILKHSDYSTTQIVYDRQERSRLAVEQGHFAEENFIKPFSGLLDEWSASFPFDDE